jgi:hypothetical protein
MDYLRILIKRQQSHYPVQQWSLNNLVILHTRNVRHLAKFQLAFLPSGTTSAIASLQQCPLRTKEQDMQFTIYVTQTRSWKNLCLGKAIIIIHSECVSVALIIQHTKSMRRIIFSSMACLDVPRFPTLSHKWHDFRENVIEHKMWVWIFSVFCLKHFSL